MTQIQTREGVTQDTAKLRLQLTTRFVVRQFVVLFLIATGFLVSFFFFNYYGVIDWGYLWDLPHVSFKYFTLPAIVAVVYGYVFFWGALFAFAPNERSFQFFFYGMTSAIFLANYDNSVLDWFAKAFVNLGFLARVPNPVSLFKILAISGVLSTIIYMHYNILSDDFTKRMIRRGIPTQEAARIRPSMMQVLAPILVACTMIAGALGLVGEFSALVFQAHGLVPKIEILLLGIFGIAVAFVLRSIIKEIYHGADQPGEAETPSPSSQARVDDSP